ncbi:hypothetical protein [Bradyrhizobium betae]|uniref:Uncharacterized protein n=1 Tax=Bradyrhizobium betae TaxID=244734 RepID=A0A5P6P1W7_9BRAD|nr:hypothetical protein [Bradyrhizobium betae]QFI72068.1 hypothetical protein F8237_06520 [Bradyrhizobium betae]
MKVPENNDFANCELSLEELDAVAGGGLWGWIKHEASSAWDWLKHDGLKVAEAIIKVITHPRRARARARPCRTECRDGQPAPQLFI